MPPYDVHVAGSVHTEWFEDVFQKKETALSIRKSNKQVRFRESGSSGGGGTLVKAQGGDGERDSEIEAISQCATLPAVRRIKHDSERCI